MEIFFAYAPLLKRQREKLEAHKAVFATVPDRSAAQSETPLEFPECLRLASVCPNWEY